MTKEQEKAERRQFEVIAPDLGYDMTWRDGDYVNPATASAWLVWQARAALADAREHKVKRD